jgi:hypothetical protein
MALNIQRGKRHMPVRAVIYGTECIGKTTLAAAFPSPVIFDTEEGTHHLDCASQQIKSWEELRSVVAEIGSRKSEFRTVVIDSADWAERLLIETLLRDNKWDSIESPGYGKGFTVLAEAFGRFLTQCDALIGAGMNVVFVAHSKVVRVSLPDVPDGFDRFELKMEKKTAPLLKEWCDLLAFCHYKTTTVEGSDKRKKGSGGKRRTMHVERCAAWDAKNRYGLDAELPMTIESLAPIFAEPAKRLGWRDRVAQAVTVEELGRIGDDADTAVSNGKLSPEQREQLDGLIDQRHGEIDTKEVIGA